MTYYKEKKDHEHKLHKNQLLSHTETTPMILITKWFGTFLYDQQGNIQQYILFPKNVKHLTKRIKTIQENNILPEEKKLVKNKKPIVYEQRLNQLGTYQEPDDTYRHIQINPEDYGLSPNILQQATQLLTHEHVEKKLSNPDLQIIQMVNAIDDLLHIANLLSERLQAWATISPNTEKKQGIEQVNTTIHKEITHLEQQIDIEMREIAPNITTIAGALIGARLIALAGSLEKLALLPTSTIQILGAEKALFRFKKEGGRPPKHGVIFQHLLINKAPRSERGRRARALASAISIAVKADAFTKKDLSQTIIKTLENRIQTIKNK